MVVRIRRVPVGGGHMIQEPGLGICMALRINWHKFYVLAERP